MPVRTGAAVGIMAAVWILSASLLAVRAQQPQPARSATDAKTAAHAEPIPLIPAENHPWARFLPGSWTMSRTTTETYDERGVATTSVEDVRRELKSVDKASYTLSIERSLEIGGRRILRQVREQTFGLSGERAAETVSDVQNLGDSDVELNGRKIPCEVRQAVFNGDGARRTTVKVFFSPEVRPHALRRESIVQESPESQPINTTETVVSVGLPYPVAGQLRSAAFRHSFQKQGSRTKESIEVICDEVPGGVVSQWSKDLDAEGKLISRVSQALVAFQVQQAAVPNTTGRIRGIDRNRGRRGDDKPGRR